MTSSIRIPSSRVPLAPLVAFALLLGAFSALAQPEAGQIVAISGRVVAVGADQAERILALGSAVFVGDHVRTERGARAQLFLLDETTISLGEESYLAIDQYVYEGKPDKDVSSLRFLRGVIRNVTGRITEANPARFQVRTGKAVIGVRGCDILFDLLPELEQIHVLEVPPRRFILVDADYRPGSQPDRHVRKSFEIKSAGQTVQLFDAGTHRRLPTPPDAVPSLLRKLEFSRRSAPASSRHSSPNGASDAAPSSEGEPAPAPDSANAPSAGQNAPPPAGLLSPSIMEFSPSAPTVDDVVVSSPAVNPNPTPPPQSSSQTQTPSPSPSPDPSPSPSPDPDPDPNPDPGPGPGPGPDVLVQTTKATGTDWSWGIWETAVTHKPDSFFAQGNALSPNSIDAIVARPQYYHLRGLGQAGAIVSREGSQNVFIDGTVDFYIKLGNSQIYDWNGAFAMGVGGPVSLAFAAEGNMGPDRNLHGQAKEDYILVVPGSVFSHGSLTQNHVDGRLVGNDSLPLPITGVLGRFQFEHGPGNPSVSGAYGTDLVDSP